jgi:DNA-binding transcriptional LysR family regulator
LIEQAGGLRDLVHQTVTRREVHVASSQYLSTYILIDAVRRFHRHEPHIRVWLSVRTERDIEQALLDDADLSFGVAAPYDPSPELQYDHLFSMAWSVITPRQHPLSRRKTVSLNDLQDQPMILLERGSTGRQHVMEAFSRRGLSPRIEMEATTTDLVVRMVAAGLGVAIIPLLPNGIVTRGHAVTVRTLAEDIRPIDSGLLLRRGDKPSLASQSFAAFIRQEIKRRRLVVAG